MRIRKQQLPPLGQAHDRALVADLIPKVVAAVPGLRSAIDDATIERIVDEAVAQARGFGLETDQEVGELVGLVFVCGERFFERPEYAWARELLASSLPARVREVGNRVELMLDTPRTGAHDTRA